MSINKEKLFEELKRRYPDMKDKEEKPAYPVDAIEQTNKVMKLEEHIRYCMLEQDLVRRIYLFERLATKCHPASVPYIRLLIRKYKDKLQEKIQEEGRVL